MPTKKKPTTPDISDEEESDNIEDTTDSDEDIFSSEDEDSDDNSDVSENDEDEESSDLFSSSDDDENTNADSSDDMNSSDTEDYINNTFNETPNNKSKKEVKKTSPQKIEIKTTTQSDKEVKSPIKIISQKEEINKTTPDNIEVKPIIKIIPLTIKKSVPIEPTTQTTTEIKNKPKITLKNNNTNLPTLKINNLQIDLKQQLPNESSNDYEYRTTLANDILNQFSNIYDKDKALYISYYMMIKHKNNVEYNKNIEANIKYILDNMSVKKFPKNIPEKDIDKKQEGETDIEYKNRVELSNKIVDKWSEYYNKNIADTLAFWNSIRNKYPEIVVDDNVKQHLDFIQNNLKN